MLGVFFFFLRKFAICLKSTTIQRKAKHTTKKVKNKIKKNKIIKKGNAFCHWTLRVRRLQLMTEESNENRNNESKRYLSLQELGVLFEWLIVPHYVFEMLEWLGAVFMFKSLQMIVMEVAIVINLIHRIYVTKKWYNDKFGASQVSQALAQTGAANPGGDATQAPR